jgi:predicted  nucleic acid-binding Zn-ribbon protein
MTFEQCLITVVVVLITWLAFRQGKVEQHMPQLDDEIQKLKDSEAALKARVQAHEDHDTQVQKDLQAQIDALKAGGDPVAAATAIEAIVADMDAFDPAAPVVPGP